ncbi:conserved protein of unknown function (plasmid) [Rhodovastum atsumiense]|uniref:Uncharacterized protein n=1 Tax=Rhodovastum atsumiense TaxID=504468 RepID=A0A5M6IQ49_9PROT|nr:hypothetical protein [Rhodovastum atsumiense]KAA5609688.1 hypothetical protein F1189_23295 [Rhodovastum atsumiense]CAH2606461.1 conserved protein of unknown function [Rhodovastum atsumiense]
MSDAIARARFMGAFSTALPYPPPDSLAWARWCAAAMAAFAGHPIPAGTEQHVQDAIAKALSTTLTADAPRNDNGGHYVGLDRKAA